jgi:hypothetical protein
VGLAELPKTTIDPQVLFFTLLRSTYTHPEYLVSVYSGYVRHQLSDALPSPQQRSLFAERYGLDVSGPEEIEQKMLSVVRIEAGCLRDNEDKWLNKTPGRMLKILDLVSNWLWTPGSKRINFC